MYTLTFKNTKELRLLAKETIEQKTFNTPYEPSKKTSEKGFYLVKDEGIYLMNAFSRNTNIVSYAVGFNPKNAKTDDQWWQMREKQQDISADDFAEKIPMSCDQLKRIAQNKTYVTIRISDDQLEVIA